MNQDELKNQDGLLQAVVKITEQRDRERLESALLATFTEVIPFRHIALYQLLPGEQGDEALLMCEGDAGSAIGTVHHASPLSVAQHAEFRAVMASGKEFVQSIPETNWFLSVYPVIGSHGLSGFLQITSGRHSEAERRIIYALLKIYGNYLGILLESETDTLTGLLNRRTFDQNIGKIIAERTAPDRPASVTGKSHRARRKSSAAPFHWLAIMDIDHFKTVNDEYGHLYGDEVLLLIAHSMRKVFRRKDKLFRFGGEEFVVVLDRTSLENAREVLERFRKTVASHDFPQIGRVTISIGFVCLAQAEVPSIMIGHADQALYYAKQNGRNQVCQYEELVSRGKLLGQQYSDDLQLF